MKDLRQEIRKMLAEMLKNNKNSINEYVYFLTDSLGKTINKGDRIKDSEGNEFVVSELLHNAVSLKGQGGEKEVDVNDLKHYTKISNTNEAQETETAPTPTIAPTTTPKQRPLKIPRPGTFPVPKPKAKKELEVAAEEMMYEWFKKVSFEEEKNKMKRFIKESSMDEMAMDTEPGKHQPHPSIKSGIEGHGEEETPFKDIDLFSKQVLDKSTLEKIASEEFKGLVDHLSTTGELGMMEIMNTLNMLVRLEGPHHGQLERLAKNTVKKYFGLSDEIMSMIDAKLKPPGSIEPPSDSDDEEELQDAQEEMFTPEELEIIKKHADKRVINNTLMMGAGYRAHKVFNSIKTELDSIDPRLQPLYAKLMANVELFLWKMPVEQMHGARQMWGKSEIKVEDENQEQNDEQGEEVGGEEQNEPQVKAEATAIIFPVLLHEVAKAAVEILFLQHLASVQEQYGEKVAQAVVKKADSYYDEHWLKLIGPTLWKYLHDALNYVVQEEGEDYTIVSFVLNKMASMEPDEFTSLLDDTIHNGPSAIAKIKELVREVSQDIEDYENQNQESPSIEDIISGIDNSADIQRAVNQERPELERAASKKVKAPKKNLADMEIDELNNELGNALEIEDYALAAQVRDEITRRMS